MADDGGTSTTPAATSTGAQLLDEGALSDIATNSKLTAEAIGNLTQAVGQMSSVVFPVASGGTGLDHSDPGGLLVGAANNTYIILDDVATSNALISGGVGSPPSWGKIGLTTHVSGILPIANGGTNASALTAHSVLLGEGTSSVAFATPGASGQILQSTGASSDPTFQALIDGIGGIFSFPNNGTILTWLNSPFACTITSTTTICTSGTCTATFLINATTIGGSANAVSVTQQVQNHTTSNVVNVGDDINITISANSSCAGMSFMIAITRP